MNEIMSRDNCTQMLLWACTICLINWHNFVTAQFFFLPFVRARISLATQREGRKKSNVWCAHRINCTNCVALTFPIDMYFFFQFEFEIWIYFGIYARKNWWRWPEKSGTRDGTVEWQQNWFMQFCYLFCWRYWDAFLWVHLQPFTCADRRTVQQIKEAPATHQCQIRYIYARPKNKNKNLISRLHDISLCV